MPCETCERALPLMLGIPIVAESDRRHATLYRCPSCGTYYEQIAEEWRGPHQRTPEEVCEWYPELC